MAYAIGCTSGDKEYHDVVLRFLEGLEDRNVQCLALVAACDDGIEVEWRVADALDLKQLAGVLDLAAVRRMIEEDYADEDDD